MLFTEWKMMQGDKRLNHTCTHQGFTLYPRLATQYLAHAGLKLWATLLPQSPKCGVYRHGEPGLASCTLYNIIINVNTQVTYTTQPKGILEKTYTKEILIASIYHSSLKICIHLLCVKKRTLQSKTDHAQNGCKYKSLWKTSAECTITHW